MIKQNSQSVIKSQEDHMASLQMQYEVDQRTFFFKEIGRFLMYSTVVVLLAELMRWDAATDVSEVKFSEGSYIEYTQSFILLVCSICCIVFFLSKKGNSFRFIFLLIFGLSAAALIREQDVYFENLFGHGKWPYPVFLILVFVIYKCYRGRFELWDQLIRYMRTKSFAFMTFGAVTVFIFSRLYGRTIFWQAVMEDEYLRSVKNVSEEGLELYGYVSILFAVTELSIVALGNRKRSLQV